MLHYGNLFEELVLRARIEFIVWFLGRKWNGYLADLVDVMSHKEFNQGKNQFLI